MSILIPFVVVAFLCSCGLADCPSADLTGDCLVNFLDFHLMALEPNLLDLHAMASQWLQSGEDDADAESLTLLGRADNQMGEPNSFAVEFVVIEKRRVQRSVFAYECEVVLTNLSPTAFGNIQLVMVAWPDNMTIIDPHVTFGDAEIGPGESATSIDTCTFTVDRSEPINPVEIIWRYVTGPQDMAFIPGETFQMGDSFAEGEPGELPVHTVTLDSFYMAKYEVTNRQYCQYLNSALGQGLITVTSGVVYKAGSGKSYPYCSTSSAPSDYPHYGEYAQISYSGGVFSVRSKSGRSMSNDPMVCVSWYGAVAYCNWRSQQEGKEQCYNLSTWTCDFSKHGYRLATEAEWEYGARGGLAGRRFPWGDTITHTQANYYSLWVGEYPHPYYPYDTSPTEGNHPLWNDKVYPYTSPVGSFPANGYGLYDMAGNVWEWCNDWDGAYSSSPQNNPTGPGSGSCHVFRGGYWNTFAHYCRVAARIFSRPEGRNGSVGFRLVLDIE
jgi:formylglycine-generating enzyme required for sulfatase activity